MAPSKAQQMQHPTMNRSSTHITVWGNYDSTGLTRSNREYLWLSAQPVIAVVFVENVCRVSKDFFQSAVDCENHGATMTL